MLQNNVSLKSYNTFAVDVQAQHFIKVTTQSQLQQLLTQPQWRDLPKLILGGGSNVLLTHDFAGLVLQIAITGIQLIKEDHQHIWLRIGAGENWHGLVRYCISQHYAGIENLSLIPGTVGAAPIQNIGAYGVELQQVFVELSAVALQDGTLHHFTHQNCQFGYRDSIFKKALKNQFVVTDITIKLDKHPNLHLTYAGLAQMLQEMNADSQPSLQVVSEAVCKIRQYKLPDPQQIANAGSFFKNPSISMLQLATLQEHHANLPYYPQNNQLCKISAAWLIEQCGWKGYRTNCVGVYANHALILVNYGGATGKQIQQLATDIQQSVQEKFAICLEPEVNIIN